MNILSIKELSRDDIQVLIKKALQRKKGIEQQKTETTNSASPKVLASLFYENSTRTRESTERAASKLGMHTIGFSGIEGTSVKKGEPLADTLRMYQGYGADIIALRHPLEGAARFAADVVDIPIINCGDGSHSHPTQTLLDLMTIVEKRGSIDNLKIALVGDLKYGRTVHSLMEGLSHFHNVQLTLVSPQQLQMPQHIIDTFQQQTNTKITIISNIADVINNVDIIYMTRIQRERFAQGPEGDYEYTKVSGQNTLSARALRHSTAGVMHPLPRYKHMLEITLDVDNLPNAWYIDQAQNGLYMREEILSHILTKTHSNEKSKIHEPSWKELPITHGTKSGDHMVYRLDDGTLIDHIDPGKGNAVLKVLKVKSDVPYIYARHLRSERFNNKDVIGFTNRELTEQELNKVALVAPKATINIVRERKVVKKGKPILPSRIDHLIICQNPRCITHETHNEHAPQKFSVENQEPLVVRCHYCEIPVTKENIRLKNQ